MASKTEIINLALTHLGAKVISSITESTEVARRAAVVYDPARDECLRSCDWAFATQIVALAEIANETVTGWDYLYAYPSNCLRVRKVINSATSLTEEPPKFRELLSPTTSAKALASDLESASAEFTYKVTDTTLYDSAFVSAFSYLLAAKLAQTLTGNTQLAGQMMNIYMALVSDARRLNSTEDNDKPHTSSPYLDAR